jgi:asparagine synthase (glutamine-hydrolysing)
MVLPGGTVLARKSKGRRPKLTFHDFKDMSYAQLTTTNLPMLLHYEDRNSMAFSIESRVPFLDYRLVEFVFQLREDNLINEGRTKYVLREAMRGKVPDKILDRRDKMGFVTAEEKWLKNHPDAFDAHLREAIDRSGGFLSPDCLKTFRNMKEGKLRFDFVIWRIISFGAWLKTFEVQV